MKILQIGAFNRNIGDSIALVNARRCWSHVNPDIKWETYDIGNFWQLGLEKKATIDFFNKAKKEE